MNDCVYYIIVGQWLDQDILFFSPTSPKCVIQEHISGFIQSVIVCRVGHNPLMVIIKTLPAVGTCPWSVHWHVPIAFFSWISVVAYIVKLWYASGGSRGKGAWGKTCKNMLILSFFFRERERDAPPPPGAQGGRGGGAIFQMECGNCRLTSCQRTL